MSKPLVIVMEGGLIQDIFTDLEVDVVIIDHDGYDESDPLDIDADGRAYEDEKYNEYLDAHVFEYGTCSIATVDADVMEAVCKHLDLENPHATNGATPPQDSQ